MDETVGALCHDDYKGINNQYVGSGKVIVVEGIRGIPIRSLARVPESRTTAAFWRKFRGGTESIVIDEKELKNGTDKGTEVLCILRKTYGEETVHKWCTAILERIQQAKVLQQGVHEESVSEKATQGNELDDGSLPCTELIVKWLLRDLRKQQECGCTSQGRKSTEQQQGQLDESLQELSQQNSQTAQNLCDMWKKGKGLWILRETLSAFQEVRKSVCGETWKSHYAVRRLTPLEAERLQGLEDNYTLIDDKSCSDSARYKALGNGMAQPCADFIIKRIIEECD